MPSASEAFPPSSSSPVWIISAIQESSRRLIKSLKENWVAWGYLVFSIGDGISNASSLIKYAHEVTNTGNDIVADRMHLWLMTPTGIVLTLIEAISISLLSILSNYFQYFGHNKYQALVRTWPYVRDSIKALKNALKSVRSLIYIAVTFGASATFLSGLLLPLGITLGAASLLNRVWSRTVGNHRKKMQTTNADLARWHRYNVGKRLAVLKKNDDLKQLFLQAGIEALSAYPDENSKINYLAIHELSPKDMLNLIRPGQSPKLRLHCYLSAAYEGLMNGLYLYAGVYLLSTLIPSLAIFVSVLSLFYVCTAVIRGLYEEFDYQRRLDLSISKAKWEIYQLLLNDLNASPEETAEASIERKKHKEDYQALKKITYKTAFGEGIRNGLSVYSAISGGLFAASLFTPIPLGVLLTSVVFGVVCLLGFVIHALHRAYQCNTHETNRLPDRFEIFRSIASGFRSAKKILNDFILNSFQEKQANGHYKDSKMMFIIMTIFSFIQAIIFGWKAYAKGFGRPPDLDDQDERYGTRLSSTTSSQEEFSPRQSTATINQQLTSLPGSESTSSTPTPCDHHDSPLSSPRTHNISPLSPPALAS